MNPAEQQASQPAPRLVRRIACCYRVGSLPGDWLQTWRRLDRVLERAGLKVKAVLEPLDDLPADVDLLVVPPELQAAARAVAGDDLPLLVTTPSTAAADIAALVRRLEAGVELTAERVDPAHEAGPTTATYRGNTRVD